MLPAKIHGNVKQHVIQLRAKSHILLNTQTPKLDQVPWRGHADHRQSMLFPSGLGRVEKIGASKRWAMSAFSSMVSQMKGQASSRRNSGSFRLVRRAGADRGACSGPRPFGEPA